MARESCGWTHPKYATAHDQPIADIHVRCIGGTPSRSSLSRLSAGRIPTNPAARGIVPVATAVVCTTIISCGESGVGRMREMRKPISADCMDILRDVSLSWRPRKQVAYMEIHPDCRPRLKFVKQIKHPIASPRITAVNVNSGWDVATDSPLTPRRLCTWTVRVVWQERASYLNQVVRFMAA